MLKFSPANAKIKALSKVVALRKFLSNKRKVYSFDLLSGFSCPYASKCLSKAVVENGRRKIKDGLYTEFRCFSASQEVLYTPVYQLRKHNFDMIRICKYTTTIANTILADLPKDAGIIRIHVAGDFINQEYFDAWLRVAKERPDVLFYAYTKSLPYWVNRKNEIPANLVLTASYGGRRDDLIEKYNLRYVRVVYHPNEAKALGLEIDHDDSHAANPTKRNKSFALLIHGQNPAGSEASKAIQRLKKEKVKYSYAR